MWVDVGLWFFLLSFSIFFYFGCGLWIVDCGYRGGVRTEDGGDERG